MVVLFDDPHTSPLATFLMQVFITLVVCKFFAKLLSFIRQPQVIGQIITGIIFGPSLLGQIPAWSNAIWPESSIPTFGLIANLGLIFFMFFLGIELDLEEIKRSWKITIPIACASITVPVGIGCAVALWFTHLNTGITTSQTAFILFVASGFGFSAFPVLATLLNSTGLLNKPIGIQIISIAAVEDITVWVVLAIASAFANGGSPLQGLYTLLLTLAFISIMVLIIRPILSLIHGYYHRSNDGTNIYVVVICFLILVVAAFTTEVMGVHAFFGAFMSGLCIPRKGELTHFLGVRIELIIVEFFLPLYFANSGLNTHLNLLHTGTVWWTLLVLLILASASKILPVTLMAKLCTRRAWNYCLSIGVLMNTRGIVQLVVLNIGVELKVLSPIIFALFVLMATILTFLTSPVIYLLRRKDSDEEKSEQQDGDDDSSLVREKDIHINQLQNHLETISNGKITDNEQTPNSTKSFNQLSSNLPVHDTYLTFDERLNLSEIDPNASGEQTIVIGNITTMPVCPPRRVVNMTRF